MYLGTNMDRAVKAAFLADRTTEAKGSGTAFFEYRDFPEKETEGKDRDEVKKVWDCTFDGARIPRAVWDFL
ncbi:MAG: hypothetical protein LUD47_01645 [Clostridia bacterium]|nr:hypothetical protein [Clostridia bacterium]